VVNNGTEFDDQEEQGLIGPEQRGKYHAHAVTGHHPAWKMLPILSTNSPAPLASCCQLTGCEPL
jgi:hypothetical protein